MNKISVIIPVYKVEKYLRQCLDSVVGQTYKNLEIIVIDDGSPDNCGAICDEYTKDTRVQVIHKQNGGLSAARNDGIARATGDWITFVDSDDWLDPDYYAGFMAELAGPEVDILCAAGAVYEYGDRRVLMRSIPDPGVFSGRAEMDMMMARTLTNKYDMEGPKRAKLFGAPWDKLYRMRLIRAHSLRFDTSLSPSEDILFNFCAFDCACAAQGCTVTGYHYRRTMSSSATHRFNPDSSKIQYSYIEKLHAHMQTREEAPVITDAMDAMAIATFSWLLSRYFFHPDNRKGYRQMKKEIQVFKNLEYMRGGYSNRLNPWLTKKQALLLALLRLPWIWPLKIATRIQTSEWMQRSSMPGENV